MRHAAFTPIEIDVQDDHVLTVRAATKADVAGIRALYEGLSAEDSHRRFFAAIRVTDSLVRRWVERCRDGGLGLVAVVDDGEALEPRGCRRWVRPPTER